MGKKLMVEKRLLLRAAKLLNVEARALRQSCSGGNGNDWACGPVVCTRDARGRCKAMVEHDRLDACVVELRKVARS